VVALPGLHADESAARVTTLRVPQGGIQPQVAVDERGTVHLVYFHGDPRNGNLFYVRSTAGGKFSEPVPVNSHPDSAIAIGNIRGAHLAVGKNGRVHVAWMGSGKAEPKAPGNASPVLYTCLNDAGTAFEPERNVIQSAVGLDGGGSVCADGAGNVYVAWHAPEPGAKGEANRRVWLARSGDEGRTFAREAAVSPPGTGVCGCCGMRAFCDRQGGIYLFYRSATEVVHRDSYLLVSRDRGVSFRAENLGKWQIGTCPMSSYALAEGGGAVLAAWETDGQVAFVRADPASGKHAAPVAAGPVAAGPVAAGPVASGPVAAPGAGHGRKHPVVAANARGEMLFAWTEGMGWNRGGSLAWQVFGKDGRPTAEKGRARGVPVWSLVAAFVRPDGGFTIIY
jgi:hypothetical protein